MSLVLLLTSSLCAEYNMCFTETSPCPDNYIAYNQTIESFDWMIIKNVERRINILVLDTTDNSIVLDEMPNKDFTFTSQQTSNLTVIALNCKDDFRRFKFVRFNLTFKLASDYSITEVAFDYKTLEESKNIPFYAFKRVVLEPTRIDSITLNPDELEIVDNTKVHSFAIGLGPMYVIRPSQLNGMSTRIPFDTTLHEGDVCPRFTFDFEESQGEKMVFFVFTSNWPSFFGEGTFIMFNTVSKTKGSLPSNIPKGSNYVCINSWLSVGVSPSTKIGVGNYGLTDRYGLLNAKDITKDEVRTQEVIPVFPFQDDIFGEEENRFNISIFDSCSSLKLYSHNNQSMNLLAKNYGSLFHNATIEIKDVCIIFSGGYLSLDAEVTSNCVPFFSLYKTGVNVKTLVLTKFSTYQYLEQNHLTGKNLFFPLSSISKVSARKESIDVFTETGEYTIEWGEAFEHYTLQTNSTTITLNGEENGCKGFNIAFPDDSNASIIFTNCNLDTFSGIVNVLTNEMFLVGNESSWSLVGCPWLYVNDKSFTDFPSELYDYDFCLADDLSLCQKYECSTNIQELQDFLSEHDQVYIIVAGEYTKSVNVPSALGDKEIFFNSNAKRNLILYGHTNYILHFTNIVINLTRNQELFIKTAYMTESSFDLDNCWQRVGICNLYFEGTNFDLPQSSYFSVENAYIYVDSLITVEMKSYSWEIFFNSGHNIISYFVVSKSLTIIPSHADNGINIEAPVNGSRGLTFDCRTIPTETISVNLHSLDKWGPNSLQDGETISILTNGSYSCSGVLEEGIPYLLFNGKIDTDVTPQVSGFDFCLSTVTDGSGSCSGYSAHPFTSWNRTFFETYPGQTLSIIVLTDFPLALDLSLAENLDSVKITSLNKSEVLFKAITFLSKLVLDNVHVNFTSTPQFISQMIMTNSSASLACSTFFGALELDEYSAKSFGFGSRNSIYAHADYFLIHLTTLKSVSFGYNCDVDLEGDKESISINTLYAKRTEIELSDPISNLLFDSKYIYIACFSSIRLTFSSTDHFVGIFGSNFKDISATPGSILELSVSGISEDKIELKGYPECNPWLYLNGKLQSTVKDIDVCYSFITKGGYSCDSYNSIYTLDTVFDSPSSSIEILYFSETEDVFNLSRLQAHTEYVSITGCQHSKLILCGETNSLISLFDILVCGIKGAYLTLHELEIEDTRFEKGTMNFIINHCKFIYTGAYAQLLYAENVVCKYLDYYTDYVSEFRFEAEEWTVGIENRWERIQYDRFTHVNFVLSRVGENLTMISSIHESTSVAHGLNLTLLNDITDVTLIFSGKWEEAMGPGEIIGLHSENSEFELTPVGLEEGMDFLYLNDKRVDPIGPTFTSTPTYTTMVPTETTAYHTTAPIVTTAYQTTAPTKTTPHTAIVTETPAFTSPQTETGPTEIPIPTASQIVPPVPTPSRSEPNPTNIPNSTSISRQIETDHQQAFFATPPGYAVIGVIAFLAVGGIVAAIILGIQYKKRNNQFVLDQSLLSQT